MTDLKNNQNRPEIICHMVQSIDGRVTGDFLYSETGIKASNVYYEINRRLKGDAFACGRVTMEGSFTGGASPDLTPFMGCNIPYEDYVAEKHDYYAVSFDTVGKVGWTDSKIHDDDPGYDDCHVIEVLTEKTPVEMLGHYRNIGVSYIFAGEKEIDIDIALGKLYNLFGIKKILLEGGSVINGAFLRAGAVDELSLVVAPIVADKNDKPLFTDGNISGFRLISSEAMDGAVWLRYEREQNA